MTEIKWNVVSEEKLNLLISKVNAGTLSRTASRYSIMEALNAEGAGVGYTQAGNYKKALTKILNETK